MRRYKVRRAMDVARDLGLIEEHLVQVCQEFGDDLDGAMGGAAIRIHDALATMRTFAPHPHQGTEHLKIRSGIRTVTSKSFIFTFEIDEPSYEVRILAIFFGGADHRRRIVDRFRHCAGIAGG